MKVTLLADGKKPPEFQGPGFYLTYANTAPICVGDVIWASCSRHIRARVLRIWFTLSPSGPHLPVNRTEPGHKHIIEVDHDLGPVALDRKIALIVSGLT